LLFSQFSRVFDEERCLDRLKNREGEFDEILLKGLEIKAVVFGYLRMGFWVVRFGLNSWTDHIMEHADQELTVGLGIGFGPLDNLG